VIRYKESEGRITFEVRVVARASRTAAAGEHDGALKVRVAAPPVGGAANEELVRFLARELGIPRRSVEIVSGHASKSKRVRVAGASVERVINLAKES
jgi:uncharacterized protein (TIGR00251 family)